MAKVPGSIMPAATRERIVLLACLLIVVTITVLFFFNLSRLLVPFPYHDEFDNVLPVLSAWGDGSLTLHDVWQQKMYVRLYGVYAVYFLFASAFGQHFYTVAIYFIYFVIAVMFFLMLWRERDSFTGKLFWTGAIAVVFTPRVVETHTWLFPTALLFFLVSSLVLFSIVKLDSSRRSGITYSACLLFSTFYPAPAIFMITFFFMLYHFWKNKFGERLPGLVEFATAIFDSARRLDGYAIAGVSYLAIYLLYFYGYQDYVPVAKTMSSDFILNFIGGVFWGPFENVQYIRLAALVLVVLMAILSRNLKSIVLTLGFAIIVLGVTWARSGFGADYAFQSRYYVYSGFVFLLLIVNAKVITHAWARKAFQLVCLSVLVGSFGLWLASPYPQQFAAGRHAAYHAYLKGQFFDTPATKYVIPELSERGKESFLKTIELGYFPKPVGP